MRSGKQISVWTKSFLLPITMNIWTLGERILVWADFEWITLEKLVLKDGFNHSWRQRDWCILTYCWHVVNSRTCQDFEKHKSSFQIFKPGPGGDSESHNSKRNKLCQVFTAQVLPENWNVRFAGEGGCFLSVFSNSKDREFQREL